MHAGPRLLLPGHSEATKLTPSLMPRCLLMKCGVKPGAGEGTAARRARRTSGLRTRGLSRKPRQPAVPGPPSAGPRPSASPRARLKPPSHGRMQAPAAPVPARRDAARAGCGFEDRKAQLPSGVWGWRQGSGAHRYHREAAGRRRPHFQTAPSGRKATPI